MLTMKSYGFLQAKCLTLLVCTLMIGCGGGTATTASTNAAPTASPGLSQNVLVGTLVSMDGSASKDPEGATLSFKWALIGKPNGSAASLSNATYPNPKFTADLAGNYVLTLVVNDGKTDSPVASVSVSATVANAIPVANAGLNQNVVVGSTVSLDGSASTDANYDSLSYKWQLQSKPSGSSAVLSSSTAARPTFKADLAGTYVATLIVSDGKANSELSVVSILASSDNSAPIANPGLNQNVLVSSLVTVDGSLSTDANGDKLTYKWSLIYKPVGSVATLSSASSVKSTFTADLMGTYLLGLTVNDGKLDSSLAVLTVVSSAANNAPTANPGTNQKVTVGTITTLDGTGSSDPDKDTLTYNWTLLSKPAASAAKLSSTTASKPTFTPDAIGSYLAVLVVNDGKANSAAVGTTVTAYAVNNSAPVANAGPNQTARISIFYNYAPITLDGSSSVDANGDEISYKWTLAQAPAGSKAVLLSATEVSPTFNADLVGTYIVTLVVSDGKLSSPLSSVYITVTN
jgi:hypothetical protein